MVREVLGGAGLSCHVLSFSQLENLLKPDVISVTTIDGRRLSLSPQRTLLAFLGCDAISLQGIVLIPSVVAGTPSDSACLAEVFIAEGDHGDTRIGRRVVAVGESYKIADTDAVSDLRTSAPLRPSLLLRLLHFVGLAAQFRAKPVNLYQVEIGLSAIVTDAGLQMPTDSWQAALEDAERHWRRRTGRSDRQEESRDAGRVAVPEYWRNRSLRRPVVVRGVVFDWNGVLVLDEPLHFSAFARLCEDAGGSLSLEVYEAECGGRTDREGIRNLVARGFLQGDVDTLVLAKQRLYRATITNDDEIVSTGTVRLLEKLVELEVPYRIVTASPAEEVDVIRGTAGIESLLPDQIIKSGVSSGDRFLALSRVLAGLASPDEVLMVDDSENNILLGKRLNMLTLRIDKDPRSCETAADFCLPRVEMLDELVLLQGENA